MEGETLKAPTALVLACALAIGAAAPALADEVDHEITLPVELKDPFVAYGLGLVPFYSMAAASYVGTSRMSGTVEPSIYWIGFSQFAGDVALFVLGTWLNQEAAKTAQQGTLPIGTACLVGIPLAHMIVYAPGWSARTGIFNRSSIAQSGFKEHSKLTPSATDWGWEERDRGRNR